MKWEEPPPKEQPSNRLPPPAWIAECRKHPKRWAMVADMLTKAQANGMQQRLTNPNNASPYPGTENEIWEATARGDPDSGYHRLYARYICKGYTPSK